MEEVSNSIGFEWDEGNIRKNKYIRVISARDMNKKEKQIYEQKKDSYI